LASAREVGKIEVEVSHGNGVFAGTADITPFALQHTESYSLAIRKQISATYYVR
jgi:hypothetical protein